MQCATGFGHTLKRIFLGLRTRPLPKTCPMVPAGVPGALTNIHMAVDTVLTQVIINKNGLDFRFFSPDQLEQRPVKNSPKIAFVTNVLEPTSVFTIAAGGYQGRKTAMLGALVNLLHEPPGIHPGFLRVGKFAVAH